MNAKEAKATQKMKEKNLPNKVIKITPSSKVRSSISLKKKSYKS